MTSIHWLLLALACAMLIGSAALYFREASAGQHPPADQKAIERQTRELQRQVPSVPNHQLSPFRQPAQRPQARLNSHSQLQARAPIPRSHGTPLPHGEVRSGLRPSYDGRKAAKGGGVTTPIEMASFVRNMNQVQVAAKAAALVDLAKGVQRLCPEPPGSARARAWEAAYAQVFLVDGRSLLQRTEGEADRA